MLALSLAQLPAADAAPHRGPTVKSATGVPAGNSVRVELRWSTRVRIVHPGRLRFVAGKRVLRGHLVTRGRSRLQRFTVRGSNLASIRRVVARRGVARTRRGTRSRHASVRVLPANPAPAPAPVAPAAAPVLTGATVTAPPAVAAIPPVGPIAPPRTTGVAPRRASDFLDSIGINVHMGYWDTTYAATGALLDSLLKLGITHVRDGICVGCPERWDALKRLADHGIKTNWILRAPNGGDSLESQIAMLAGPMRSTVDSIENLNEYDISGDPDWAAVLRSYQQRTWDLVKATPSLAGVPVIGPSFAWLDDYGVLGDLSGALDYGNFHPYAGGHLPTNSLGANLRSGSLVAGSKPLIATEAGYNNAVANNTGHRPVSETAAAAYLPRTYLDFFAAGVARTYLYELIDEWPDAARRDQESNFGLLRSDYSEKPAYGTLRALISSLAPTSSEAFGLVPLDYQLGGATRDVRQMLLQTGPGDYRLVLWRDNSLWDVDAGRDLGDSSVPVRVTLGQGQAGVSVRPLSGTPAPIASADGRAFDVPVSGMPTVVSVQG